MEEKIEKQAEKNKQLDEKTNLMMTWIMILLITINGALLTWNENPLTENYIIGYIFLRIGIAGILIKIALFIKRVLEKKVLLKQIEQTA